MTTTAPGSLCAAMASLISVEMGVKSATLAGDCAAAETQIPFGNDNKNRKNAAVAMFLTA
jgi:hypothetical protein